MTKPDGLKVMHSTGATVYSKLIDADVSGINVNLDLSDISVGLYFVLVQKGDILIREKLIITK